MLVIVGVLAVIAYMLGRTHINRSHDVVASSVATGAGSHVGFTARTGAGPDFTYTTADLSTGVLTDAPVHADHGPESTEFGEVGYAVGTDPVSGEGRSLLVVKSRSGRCAWAAYGPGGSLIVEKVTDSDAGHCSATQDSVSAIPELAAAVTLPASAPAGTLVAPILTAAPSTGSITVTWTQPASSIPVDHYEVHYMTPNSAAVLFPRPASQTATWSSYGTTVTVPASQQSYSIAVSAVPVVGGGWGREFYVDAVAADGTKAPSNTVSTALLNSLKGALTPCTDGTDYVYALPHPATWGPVSGYDDASPVEAVMRVGGVTKKAMLSPGQVGVFRFPVSGGTNKTKVALEGVPGISWTGSDSAASAGACTASTPQIPNTVNAS